MAVDVVVVNYRTYGDLERFCDSWLEAKFEGCTLTVVDVEGAARLGDEVRSHHQIDHWINTEENCGYARACNFGAAHGTNDVVLLANADTLLTPELWDCYLALRSHADWGVLGPRQVDARGAITAGGIFGTDTNIGQRGWQELDRGQYSDIRDDAKSVSGSLYFIKRALWEELTACEVMQKAYPGIRGAFIPTQHYYEETACSYHARAHGYKIVYYGPVQMTHLWHRASPHGGKADSHVETSKAMMREFCRMHNIVCE